MASDREAIERLIFLYAERLDAGDLEGVADLFGRATFRSDQRPDVRRGRGEILGTFRDSVVLYDGLPRTKHVTTNLVVDVEPKGEARSRSCFTVFQACPGLPLQAVIAGRYHDRFRRVAGGWEFADRLVIVDLVGDLRFHLRRDPGD